MIFDNTNFPWKIILTHKKYGDKRTSYRSTTDFLAFDEEVYSYEIFEAPPDNKPVHQMQTMWRNE